MELWTSEHGKALIPGLAILIAIAVVLRLTLGKKSRQIRMIPIQILACLLVVIEIGKQTVSLLNGYDLYCLPFHYCSLFIFAVPLMAFYRGKHEKIVCGVTTALCSALFLIMLVYPNLIYGPWNVIGYFSDYMSFHTVTFHHAVMLVFLLIIALDLHTPGQKGETNAILLTMVGFSIVAATMAQLLKTNFANFYSCNIPVFETVRTYLQPIIGSVLTQLIYMLAVAALQTLFTLMTYYLYVLISKITQKTKQEA